MKIHQHKKFFFLKFFIIIFLVVVALSIFYLTLNINYLNPGEAFFLMADGGESSGRV